MIYKSINHRKLPSICQGLVPTSDIVISLLFRSGNAEKYNPQKDAYDRHNHNHKEMIEHFLMIVTMIVMSLVGTKL